LSDKRRVLEKRGNYQVCADIKNGVRLRKMQKKRNKQT